MNAFSSTVQVDITILVKALNEEEHIEACLRSAIAALAGMNKQGEVLLADSLSTDRTVEIAKQLGVRIVQFTNARDRSCGAALQLGYQFALGRFIYVLDGDMQLVPEFLKQAYDYLQEHPDVAGVGGRLIDTHVRTEDDRKRNEYYTRMHEAIPVSNLGGGGLYRRDAIEAVGYLSNRWLPAFEEAELGVRLRAVGYRLIRLPDPAVLHTGHSETSMQMLARLWGNRRIEAPGIFLRSAFGQPYFVSTVKHLWFAFVAPTVYAIAALSSLAGALAGLPTVILFASPLFAWACILGLFTWRKRSLARAAVGVAYWHMYALGAFKGALQPVRDPRRPIEAREFVALS